MALVRRVRIQLYMAHLQKKKRTFPYVENMLGKGEAE